MNNTDLTGSNLKTLGTGMEPGVASPLPENVLHF